MYLAVFGSKSFIFRWCAFFLNFSKVTSASACQPCRSNGPSEKFQFFLLKVQAFGVVFTRKKLFLVIIVAFGATLFFSYFLCIQRLKNQKVYYWKVTDEVTAAYETKHTVFVRFCVFFKPRNTYRLHFLPCFLELRQCWAERNLKTVGSILGLSITRLNFEGCITRLQKVSGKPQETLHTLPELV